MPSKPRSSPSERPLVFFMPSAEGDAAPFVRLRSALEERLSFEVISYPTWRELVDAEADFGMLVDGVLKQIRKSSSGPTYRLAGYSFGGFVAWEVARRLAEAGGHVEFVGLIDARWQVRGTQTFSESLGRKIHNALRQPRRTLATVGWRFVFPFFVRRCPRRGLYAFYDTLSKMPEARSFVGQLLVQLRLRSLGKWVPGSLDAPVFLFRSDEFSPHLPDFGWSTLCRQLEVVQIGGSHLSIFDPPHLDILADRFLGSVCAAGGRRPVVSS
jgi:phthiocerol/phenolphthiocerol synthesis type-I polyketide synthase D